MKTSRTVIPELVGITLLFWIAYHVATWLAKRGLTVLDIALQTAGMK